MKPVIFLGILATAGTFSPARAVVLEQKWTPGQDLNYQTALRGTVSVQTPASANFPLAGVPFDVEINGDGIAQLQTLSVDGAGVGVIAMRIPKFDLRGESWGQKGLLSLTETSSKVTLNGRAIKMGDGKNPLGTAKSALRISRQGRVLGLQPLEIKAKTNPQAESGPVDAASAINQGALMTAAVIRALPTLWPGRDIKVGESWQAQIIFPVASPTDAKKIVPTQFGEWNLTLEGTDVVAGRALQRVGVKGSLSVDSAQFTLPTAKTPRGLAKQEVSGDLWLDAAAGQIARADLVIGARVEAGKGTKDAGHADFTGTLQMNLQDAA